jgi:hypothetical protein
MSVMISIDNYLLNFIYIYVANYDNYMNFFLYIFYTHFDYVKSVALLFH